MTSESRVPSVGLVLPQYESSWEEALRLAAEAERVGFAALWLEDHFRPWAHADTGPALEGWTTIAALSQVTSRIRLGTLVTCTSYREPALVAKMGATLDVISGGRFILGIGAGWYAEEYEAYGYPFPAPGERVGRLRDAVRIVRAMWTEESPTLVTPHYTVREARCNPRPLQRPSPPIWIGGGGPRILRIAARHADGWNYGAMTPQQFAAKREALRAYVDAAGRGPDAVTASLELFVFLGATEAEARERVRAFEASRPPGNAVRLLIRDAYCATRIEGSPDEVARRLAAYAAAGVDHFTLVFPDPDLATIRLFGEEVLPRLAAACHAADSCHGRLS